MINGRLHVDVWHTVNDAVSRDEIRFLHRSGIYHGKEPPGWLDGHNLQRADTVLAWLRQASEDNEMALDLLMNS